MIEKLIWSQRHIKINPFGGQEGFRPLRITFHDQSFINLSNEDSKILEILTSLATLSHIDAMSFEGQVYPKIIIDAKESENGLFNLYTIASSDSRPVPQGGVYKAWLDEFVVGRLMEINDLQDENRLTSARKDLLCVKTHNELNRDIFITLSNQLINNRDKFGDINIATPLEALKIVSICLRTRNEFDWMREIKGNETFPASRRFFYEYLTRGLLPDKREYLTVLGSHPEREELIQLRWSVFERCSKALQTRDEITRLYYKPETTDAKDLRSDYFAYLTLLLTGALDAQALIINKIYNLGETDQKKCGLHNESFKKRIRNNSLTKGIGNLLDSKEQFIKEILVKLRNKIHSVNLKEEYCFPENSQDELKKLLDRIYDYDPNSHWGVQKQKITRNGEAPVPSFKYILNTYTLGFHLITETFALMNAIMEETKTEDDILNKSDRSKIKTKPSPEMDEHIQTCLLLG
jgi:hypothetical protein